MRPERRAWPGRRGDGEQFTNILVGFVHAPFFVASGSTPTMKMIE